MTYPLEGNESGHRPRLRANEAQRDAALRVRETRRPGARRARRARPGRPGFIGRFPVFIRRARDANFWGIVSAVIDVDRLYRRQRAARRDSTSRSPSPAGTRAARRHAVLRRSGRLRRLAGDARRHAALGRWRIAAVPEGRLGHGPANAWVLRSHAVRRRALVLVPTLSRPAGSSRSGSATSPSSAPRAELAAAVAPPRAALDASRGRRLGNQHRDRRAHMGRPHERALRLPADGGPRNYQHLERPPPSGRLARAEADFRTPPRTPAPITPTTASCPDGSVRHVRAHRRASIEDPRHPAAIVGVNWDVTADVALNEELKRANDADRSPQCRARNDQRASSTMRCTIRSPACPTAAISTRCWQRPRGRAARRRAAARAAPHRSRPLQADQRHARPCRRRRDAHPRRRGAEATSSRGRFRRPHRRRRIRHRPPPVDATADALGGSPTASSSRCASR